MKKPSSKELTAWLLSKLHAIRQLKYRLKMIMQTEVLRESRCKTAVLVEKHLVTFLACHPESLPKKIKHFIVDVLKIDVFKFDTLFYIEIFSVALGKFRC